MEIFTVFSPKDRKNLRADIRSIKMLHNSNCDVVEHKLFFEAQIISHKTIDFFTKVWYHDNGDNNDYRFSCKK